MRKEDEDNGEEYDKQKKIKNDVRRRHWRRMIQKEEEKDNGEE